MLYTSIIYITLANNDSGGEKMPKRKHYVERDESEDDISIYSKEARESLLDNDELSPMEEAFMEGYEEAV